MKIKYFVYGGIVLVLAWLIYHRVSENNAAAKEKAPKEGGSKAVGVNGVVVRPRNFANALSVSGSIEANEQVQIRSQIAGVIRHLYFQEGSDVKAGQTLLSLEDSEWQASLDQAVAKEELSAENEKRTKQLLDKQSVSQQEYDMAQADLKTLHAQTQLIQAQLAKTTIKAPFSGKIGLRKVSIGEYLDPSTVVANLVNLNPVKLTFSIPEKYAYTLKPNAVVSFSMAGLKKQYKAKVYAVEPGIDALTRTLQLKAKADNADGSLLPGAFATVDLPLMVISDAILIPTEAIVPVQNGRKVFVCQNGKAKEVMVETSTRTEEEVLVVAGLKKGDTVLTTGVMSLRQGTPVKVKIQKESVTALP